MKVVALVQARMGSNRLPGKVMRKIGEVTMIELVLRRLSRATLIDQIVVATTLQPTDKQLADHVTSLGYAVSRGSEDDVLDRFYQAAAEHKADVVVRVTADCPLIDPAIVDTVIRAFLDQQVDYMSNVSPPTFPDGLDVEVFSFAALKRAADEATETPQREHVTPYLRNHPEKFSSHNVTHSTDLSALRWTLDEPADYALLQRR